MDFDTDAPREQIEAAKREKREKKKERKGGEKKWGRKGRGWGKGAVSER